MTPLERTAFKLWGWFKNHLVLPLKFKNLCLYAYFCSFSFLRLSRKSRVCVAKFWFERYLGGMHGIAKNIEVEVQSRIVATFQVKFLISLDEMNLKQLTATSTPSNTTFFATTFPRDKQYLKKLHIYRGNISEICRASLKIEVLSRITIITSHKNQHSLERALGLLVSSGTTENQQISPPLVYISCAFEFSGTVTSYHNQFPVSIELMQITDPKLNTNKNLQAGVCYAIFSPAVSNITAN